MQTCTHPGTSSVCGLWVIVAVAWLDSRFSAAPGKLLQDVVVSNYDCQKKQDDRQIVHGHQDCTTSATDGHCQEEGETVVENAAGCEARDPRWASPEPNIDGDQEHTNANGHAQVSGRWRAVAWSRPSGWGCNWRSAVRQCHLHETRLRVTWLGWAWSPLSSPRVRFLGPCR